MSDKNEGQTRRGVLKGAAAAAALLPSLTHAATAAATYRRYDVMSPEGQKMLASYAKGVAAMLALPADHPHNWFRNAFVHLMDCPHGNWWFYVWHRGYVGYFEQTIRKLSGDAAFAMPYWDWTTMPRIPDQMFDGVLTPTDPAYAAFTGNIAVFSAFIEPALRNYFNGLTSAQRAQLDIRGYSSFDLLWNDVNGYSPQNNAGISGNIAFAPTCSARYLSRGNPNLDPKTAYDVSPGVIRSGLAPTLFYDEDVSQSFTSSKTPSHNTAPSSTTQFSMLEGLPHNKVHNCIGGSGPLDPGPYGNMTNFLSPVDPIFFLHHANMDRLWDVWQRKQMRLKLPYLPTGSDLQQLSDDPFLFFFDEAGAQVSAKASDFFETSRFDYDYAPGFGEDASGAASFKAIRKVQPKLYSAAMSGASWSVKIPQGNVEKHLANAPGAMLAAELTFPRPEGLSATREFDVLVNAPEGVDHVTADSPYYAGTVAFFGPSMAHMPGMDHAMDATFAVPLPRSPAAFKSAELGATTINIRVVPSNDRLSGPPALKGVRLQVQ
jgi:tyrosinase